jgi:hypothetical protein
MKLYSTHTEVRLLYITLSQKHIRASALIDTVAAQFSAGQSDLTAGLQNNNLPIASGTSARKFTGNHHFLTGLNQRSAHIFMPHSRNDSQTPTSVTADHDVPRTDAAGRDSGLCVHAFCRL